MSHILEFLDLVDVPNTYSGLPGRPVIVNATVDGVTFSDLAADYVSLVSYGFGGILHGGVQDVQTAMGVLDDHVHDYYLLRSEWNENGFVDSTDVAIAWNDGTRTLTISPVVDTFEYYYGGEKTTEDGSLYAIIDDTEGLWVFYIAEKEAVDLARVHNPSYAQVEDLILNHVIVAYVYWDATNNDGRLMDERHGSIMGRGTHHYLHEIFGSQYLDGMTLGDITTDQNGSLDAHAQFSITAGRFYDEDIEHDTLAHASTDTWECYYVNGDGNVRWVNCEATFPVYAIGGVIAWNNAGTLTPADNNKFILYHVFTTNIKTDSGGDYYPVVMPGIAQYGSKAAAQDAAASEIQAIDFGDWPTEEIIPVATVIYHHLAAMGNGVEAAIQSTEGGGDFVDWRFTTISGSSTSVNDHGGLSGLADVADHPGYVTLDGLRPLTADWDAGSFEIRAESFQSDVATGTAPLTIASSTLVNNLNADLLDGNEASAFATSGHTHSYLPLAAGSGSPLTGTLYVQPSADPAIRILPSSGSITYFDISASSTTPWEGAGQLFYESPSGLNASLLFDVYPADGTSDAAAYFFATGTTTTGSVRLGIGLGDGTYDLQHIFRGDNGDVILGNQTVGTFTYGGTNVSLEGHTHFEADITDLGSYLPLGGGTLTGDLSRDSGGAYAATLGVDRLSIGASGTIGRVYRGGSWIELGYIPSGGATYDALRVVPGAVPQYISGATPYNLALADDLDDYLPLTAGSGEALTGNLHLDAVSDPTIYLKEGASTTSFTELRDRSANVTWFRKTAASGAPIIFVDPIISDGSSGSEVGFFRVTSSTGASIFNVYLGDGTASIQHAFNAGTGDVDLCQQGGDLTIGAYHTIRSAGSINFFDGQAGALILGDGTAATNLQINALDDPKIDLWEGASSADKTTLIHVTEGRSQLLKVRDAGDAVMEIDARPQDGTGAAIVYINRYTNTTGGAALRICEPDGTGTIAHELNGTSGDVDLCQQGGDVTVGSAAGTSTLYLDGDTDPTIYFREGGDVDNYGRLYNIGLTYPATVLETVTDGYAAPVNIQGLPQDGTSTAYVSINASTNTTGGTGLLIYDGQNTGTGKFAHQFFGSGTVQLARNGGNVTLGADATGTSNLYLDADVDPSIFLREGGSTTSYSALIENGDTLFWEKTEVGNANIQFNAKSSGGAGNITASFFRWTNTSGSVDLLLYQGDNTGTLAHSFECDTGNVLLAQQGGTLTVEGDEVMHGTDPLFYAYDAAGGTTIGTSYTDIPWDTEGIKGADYTHSTVTNPAEITFNTAGYYELHFDCTATNVNASARYQVNWKLQIDTGSGFADIGHSPASSYHRVLNVGTSTAPIHLLLNISSGDKIKLQAVSGSATDVSTTALRSRATIKRLT